MRKLKKRETLQCVKCDEWHLIAWQSAPYSPLRVYTYNICIISCQCYGRTFTQRTYFTSYRDYHSDHACVIPATTNSLRKRKVNWLIIVATFNTRIEYQRRAKETITCFRSCSLRNRHLLHTRKKIKAYLDADVGDYCFFNLGDDSHHGCDGSSCVCHV